MAAMARWCFQRRAWVLIGWLALLAVLGVTGRAAGSAYSDSLTLPGTGSTTAQNLLEQAFPGHAGDQETIVWRASSGSVSAPAVRDRITAMLGQVAAAPAVASVTSPYSARGAAQVSRNGQIAYATVVFDAPQASLPVPDVTRVVHLAEAARAPGVQVDIGGPAVENALRPSVGISAGVGVIAAAIVLFIAFGSLLAMLAAPGHRDRRAGLGPDDDRAPLARGDHSLGRPDAGHLDRARRGHRLRAVHRHPAPQQPQGRDVPPGRRGPRAEHLRPRGPVRRDHRVHRPARDARAAHRLHLRPGHRRGDHRRCSRWPPPPPCCPRCSASSGCGCCPAGNAAGWPPTGPRPTAPPGRGRGWPRSCSATPPRWPPPPPPSCSCWPSRCSRCGWAPPTPPTTPPPPPPTRPTTCSPTGFGPGFNGPLELAGTHQLPRGCGRVRPAGRHAADRARDRRGLRARGRPRRLADQRDHRPPPPRPRPPAP